MLRCRSYWRRASSVLFGFLSQRSAFTLPPWLLLPLIETSPSISVVSKITWSWCHVITYTHSVLYDECIALSAGGRWSLIMLSMIQAEQTSHLSPYCNESMFRNSNYLLDRLTNDKNRSITVDAHWTPTPYAPTQTCAHISWRSRIVVTFNPCCHITIDYLMRSDPGRESAKAWCLLQYAEYFITVVGPVDNRQDLTNLIWLCQFLIVDSPNLHLQSWLCYDSDGLHLHLKLTCISGIFTESPFDSWSLQSQSSCNNYPHPSWYTPFSLWNGKGNHSELLVSVIPGHLCSDFIINKSHDFLYHGSVIFLLVSNKI